MKLTKEEREAEIRSWERFEMRHAPVRVLFKIVKFLFYVSLALAALKTILEVFGD